MKASNGRTARPTRRLMVHFCAVVFFLIVNSTAAQEMVSYPSQEVAFICGPQLRSNSPLNPYPWFDSTATTKGASIGAALPTKAPRVLTGTVSVNTNSSIVIGNGTRFLAEIDPNGPAPYYDGWLQIVQGGVAREVKVASVQSNTQLTLTAVWSFGSVSGAQADTYHYHEGSLNYYHLEGWNYYDTALALYINYYRTNDPAFLAHARKVADAWWSTSAINFGTTFGGTSFPPRAQAYAGLMLRALDGKPEYWDYLYRHVQATLDQWVKQNRNAASIYDIREQGYPQLYAVLLARVLPDQYPLHPNGTLVASTQTATDGAQKRAALLADVEDLAVNFFGRLQKPDGSWRWDIPGEGVVNTEQPFMTGLYLESVILLHQLSTNSNVKANLLNQLTKSVTHLHNDAYEKDAPVTNFPPYKWRATVYYWGGGTVTQPNLYNPPAPRTTACGLSQCGENSVSVARHLNSTIHHAFGYAYLVTGDPQYRTMGDEMFGASFGDSTDTIRGLAADAGGKEYAMNYRASGRYLAWRITNAPKLLISELRTSGPVGAGDDFVEIYNNSDVQLTVSTSDGSAGFGLFKIGSNCSSSPTLIGTIPNGTVIPARGHYLFVGSQYSLQNYGGTNAAAGDRTLTSDIENDRNLAIFSTANAGNLSVVTRLDAVGFGANTGSTCDLFREGNTLPAVSGSATEHSYFRKLCDFVAGVGCSTPGTPKDTNQNLADFMFADTNGYNVGGQQRLGAPGPENLASPIKRDPAINGVLLDATVGASVSPNRVRNTTSEPSATFGTMTFSFRFVNQTGAPVGRLRFRIVEMTTFPSPSGSADLRALTSNLVVFSGINDAATCLASTGSSSTPCVVNVQGTTLEAPPAQPFGGGLNSTLSAGTVTLGSPLAPGASVNVQLRLGVERTGSFRFLVNVEALPASGSSVPVTWTEIAYATPEADGGIVTTTLESPAHAAAVQQLTSGKYFEIVPNQVAGNSQYRFNTVGNRNVYRRLSIGGGYLHFYNTAGAWQHETTVTTSSVIRISLEGTNLKVYKDGTLVYTFTDTLNGPFEMRMSFWVESTNLGAGLTSASFGP